MRIQSSLPIQKSKNQTFVFRVGGGRRNFFFWALSWRQRVAERREEAETHQTQRAPEISAAVQTRPTRLRGAGRGRTMATRRKGGKEEGKEEGPPATRPTTPAADTTSSGASPFNLLIKLIRFAGVWAWIIVYYPLLAFGYAPPSSRSLFFIIPPPTAVAPNRFNLLGEISVLHAQLVQTRCTRG
jgi:hypothetical protein